MAATGATVISKATAMLGKGGTTVWNYYGLAKGTAWCVGFVSYIMDKAGAKSLFYGGKAVFYVPYAQEWLAENCTHVKMADAKPGDIVVFTWDGIGNNSEKGSRDHIGFIRKAGTSKTAYTIEGNTNGGIVADKTRALKWIYGIYRPKYDTTSTTTTKKTTTTTAKKSTTTKTTTATKTSTSYKVGKNYTLQDAMNVRTGAGTNYSIKKVSQLTADGKKHATSKSSTANAVLKKGTKVTALAVKTVGNNIWLQIPSGWVCAKLGSTIYIK